MNMKLARQCSGTLIQHNLTIKLNMEQMSPATETLINKNYNLVELKIKLCHKIVMINQTNKESAET